MINNSGTTSLTFDYVLSEIFLYRYTLSLSIISVREGDYVSRGETIGKIRWDPQFDMIIPRNNYIFVREREQVYTGSKIVGRIFDE